MPDRSQSVGQDDGGVTSPRQNALQFLIDAGR